MTGNPSLKTAALFTVFALGFAWLYWLAVILARAGILGFSMETAGIVPDSIPGVVLWAVLRGFGPAIAGVLAIWIVEGRAGVVALGGSLLRWRIRPVLYLAAMFGIVVNGAALLAMAAVGELHASPIPVGRFVLFFFAMMLLDGPLGEEVGWRGTLLPRVLERLGAVKAALLVGVIWYLWHVPLYAADAKLSGGFDQAKFLYYCIALSLIFTWLFIRSGGSVLLAVYAHSWSNYATFLRVKGFAPSQNEMVPVVTSAVVTLLALAAWMALRTPKYPTAVIPD